MAVVCDAFLEAILGVEAARALAARLSLEDRVKWRAPDAAGDAGSTPPGLDLLAAKLSMSPRRVLDLLAACDERIAGSFGFGLHAARWDGSLELRPEHGGLPRLSLPAQSLAFGADGLRLVHPDSGDDLVPVDEASARWIDLLVEAARRGRTAHFIYRMRCRDLGSDDYAREVDELAATFATAAAGSCLVLSLGRRDRNPCGGAGAFDAMASGVIPAAAAGRAALKLFRGPNALAGARADPDANPPREDEFIPPEEAARSAFPGLSLLAPLLPRLVGVHVWCCPRDVRL